MSEKAYNISSRNKWCYSSGCLGRDMAYTIVSMYWLTYLQFACFDLINESQLAVIIGVIVVCRVWDAINDPMMGAIITNTKSRYGKYRPWILIGALTNAFTIIGLFTFRAVFWNGWGFVIVISLLYFVWELTFTMNDVSYWSLLPALTSDKKQRDNLTTLVAVFASLGAFSAAGVIMLYTPGRMVEAYRLLSIVIAIIFVICQIMVFFMVKEHKNYDENSEKVTLKKMFSVIKNNKQLLWMALVVLLYSLGSAILNAFGMNYFYFAYGYGSASLLVFTAIYACGTIVSQAIYPVFASKLKRKQIITIATLMIIIGYLGFFVVGALPIPNIVKLCVLCIFAILIFVGQGLFYLPMLVMLMNTIEYDEWQKGVRNESIVFSIRPFMVKLASAFQQLIVFGTLSITGIYRLSKQISAYEIQQSKGLILNTDVIEKANELINTTNNWQIVGVLFSMTIIPAVLFFFSYYIIKKKYIIDETMYEKIISDISSRKANVEI